MFGSEILEVVIALIGTYWLASLFCSALAEGIEAFIHSRAVHLERGIRELLHDRAGTGITQAVYQHPLVYSLYRGEYDPRKINRRTGWMPMRSQLPSYIPSANFAMALLDSVARWPVEGDGGAAPAADQPLSVELIRRNLPRLQNPGVQRALLLAIDAAGGDLARIQGGIETWYDSAMDRIGGWYKRHVQWILLFLGLAVTIGINVNTILITQSLMQDSARRQAVVGRIDAAVHDPAARDSTIVSRLADIEQLGLPLGWGDGWPGPNAGTVKSNGWLAQTWHWILLPVTGWMLTALAISLGAPFWFDTLNRIMTVRSTVKPAAKSGDGGS